MIVASGAGSTSEVMTMDADEFFRQDAKARGMKLPDYEREFGVQINGGPALARIAYNELPAGVMGDEDVARALHFERNFVRAQKRRRARSYARTPTPRRQHACLRLLARIPPLRVYRAA